MLHCERRPTHCIKSTAAQGDGYSGTSGLVLGLSSITSVRGELVSLLRRYFNTLYPVAFTLLRNLVQSYAGCTLIPSRHISHSFKHASSHTYRPFSARSRCSHPPWVCPTSISTAYHRYQPTQLVFVHPCLHRVCVQLSRSSRNDAVLPLVPPKFYWTFRGRPRLAKDAFPRSHATYRAIARGIRSGPLGPFCDTLLNFRGNSCRVVVPLVPFCLALAGNNTR